MGLALSWCKSRIADIDTVRLHHPSLLCEVATMPLGMTQALLGEFVYLVELVLCISWSWYCVSR